MNHSELVAYLEHLHAQKEQALKDSRLDDAVALQLEIEETNSAYSRREHHAPLVPVEGWMVLGSILLCGLALLLGGGAAFSAVLCALVVFWTLPYGLVYKVLLGK